MIRAVALPLALALALALGLLAPVGAAAQPDPAAAAEAAAARLDRAADGLAAARSGRDRVAALTETVRAYEDGLVAFREGLRRVAVRQRALELELDSRSGEVARLLGVLSTMGRSPAPLLLLHPSGALGTARSGMILSDVTPALQAEVDDLRAKLEEVQTLRALQADAADTLARGLDGAQEARARLSEAIAERTDLPRRFVEDEVATALLLASSDTLTAFAGGLADTAVGAVAGPPDGAGPRKGALPLPVRGRVLRGYREADAAGIERPGLVIAARPRALVTAPAAATLRYAGPLLDYGNVAILEPAADVLIVVAGLAEVFGRTGEVLPAGSPVGLMGGSAPKAQAILSETSDGAGAARAETLYVEIREGQDTVDPADWFALE